MSHAAVASAFPLSAAFAVIGAGMLHATWNAMAKANPDRVTTFALYGAAYTVCGAIAAVFAPAPAVAAWPYLAASGVLHAVYSFLLVRSYRLGDFNQVYPIARGSAPLLVALPAAVFAGDRLTVTELAGIAVICAGLGVLALVRPRSTVAAGATGRSGPAVRAALLTGASIAAYTISDGLGVRASGTAVGYASWLFVVTGPPILAWALAGRVRHVLAGARRQLASGLAGGVLGVVGYAVVLWAQTTGALAVVAALRETGVITGAIIGVAIFRERAAAPRIIAAVMVAAGAAVINLR
jgi:drug/metabolite transporter (DMT)-like permease